MKFQSLKHPFGPTKTEVFEDNGASEFPTHVKFEGIRRQALETGRNRLLVTGSLFILAFVAVSIRLFELALVDQGVEEVQAPRLAIVSELPKSVPI